VPGDAVGVAAAVPADVDPVASPELVDVVERAVAVKAGDGGDVVAGDGDGRPLSGSADVGPEDWAPIEAGADAGSDGDPRYRDRLRGAAGCVCGWSEGQPQHD